MVLIGSLSTTTPGAIATITRAFMNGLGDKYRFVAHYANRKYGGERPSALNPVNLFYFAKHFLLWIARTIMYRPTIAHYPLGSYWNLEKSLLFMKAARLCGASTVGHLHSGAFVTFWKTVPPWRKRMAQGEISALAAVIVLSNGWKDLVHTEVGIDLRRIHVVNNPIDEEFETAALTMSADRQGGYILYLGAFSLNKGAYDAIEAFARTRKSDGWKFVLVGPEREPDGLENARALAGKLGIADRLEILDGAWGNEKIDLFRRASIFFFPSRFENFPLVVLEAAASGMAILTTPVGALPEFFTDGQSALFVPVGAIDALANALDRLIDDPALRKGLGSAARDVFNARLSRARIMASLDTVYQDVLHKRN